MDDYIRELLYKLFDIAGELSGYIKQKEEETERKRAKLEEMNKKSDKIVYPNFKQYHYPSDTCANIENSIKKEKTDFEAATKKEENQMLLKFEDGSFRTKRRGLEYRFMLNGVQMSVCGKTEEICFNKRLKRMDEVKKERKNTTITQKTKQLTFGEWLSHWFETYKIPHLTPESIARSKGLIDKYIAPGLGDIHINKLDHDSLQVFLNRFIPNPNNQKKIYHIIHGSLEKAFRSGKIKTNPSDGLDLKRYTKKKCLPLQIGEQDAVYHHLLSRNEKYHKLFMFCCCTGIRIGRVLTLKRDDIDFENHVINVKMKQRMGLNESYEVPFLPELLNELPNSGKLFGNITKSAARTFFDRIFDELNIKNISIHSFRHTFISMLNFIGVPLKQAQVWAGHKTFSVTADVYTHIIKNNGTSPILEYLRRLKSEFNV